MTRRINGDALENRAGTAATGDVFTFNDAHADGGQWQAPAAGGNAFPVGAVFIAVVATNPATLLGYGTWSAFGAGRVLVGLDSGDTDFDTVEETGGAKTAGHTHGAGTYQADFEPDHSHGAGTLATSAHTGTAVGAHTTTDWDHKHAINSASLATISAHSGTAVATHSNHTHGKGTLAIVDPATGINEHARHRHEITGILSHRHSITGSDFAHTHPINAGQGSHAHPQQVRSNNTAGTAGSQGANAANATTVGTTSAVTLPAMTANSANLPNGFTQYEGAATLKTLSAEETATSATWETIHNVDGDTATESPSLSHSVTEPSAHTLGGTTEGGQSWANATVAHSVTQPSAHTMSGLTAGGGGHGHTVSGTSGSGTGSIVQPYIVVYMWKRTA